MRSYIWFVLGVYLSLLLGFALSACTMGVQSPAPQGDVSVRPPPSTAQSGLVVRDVSSNSSVGIALAGTTRVVAMYRVENTAQVPRDVREFTVCVSNADAVDRLSYGFDGSDDADAAPLDPDGCVTFTPASLQIASGTTRVLTLSATFANISGDVSIAPRSGARVACTIVSLSDNANVEALVVTSPTTFVLRKTRLDIFAEPLSVPSLVPGAQELFRWDMSASPVGDVAIKQIVLHMEIDAATICNVHLYRDSRPVEDADVDVFGVDIVTGELVDLELGCVSSDVLLYYYLPFEMRLRAGDVHTYAVYGDVASIDTFSRVRTFFAPRDVDVTSAIACTWIQYTYLVGAPEETPSFIWSDISEDPHRPYKCNPTTDWIGDAEMTGLSFVEELN